MGKPVKLLLDTGNEKIQYINILDLFDEVGSMVDSINLIVGLGVIYPSVDNLDQTGMLNYKGFFDLKITRAAKKRISISSLEWF